MLKKSLFILAAAALGLAGCGDGSGGSAAGGARNQIRIVGSSTVYPFSKAVAERFAQTNPSYAAPIVESTGTGAGMKLFCAGVGSQYPDVENASRRIKSSELEDCRRNGVTQVIEVPIGIDGLAFVTGNDAQTMNLTLEDIYEALAANPYGQPQTAKTWKDVNPSLPATPIQVFGPPPTSGTRDALAEMIMEKGCDLNPEMKALKASDSDRHKDVCTKIREDGAFVEAGENDNLLVQKVAGNTGAVGVLGYSFLDENRGSVKALPISGVEPTDQTIASFDYPGARQLYIYVKGEHMKAVPGLREFLGEYARAWGEQGYLAQHGLIPSPADVQQRATAVATQLTPVNASELK